MRVKIGECLATQGEIRTRPTAFSAGPALNWPQKNGGMHPVGHRCRGDLIGISSVLTEEPQRAHIEAETDMELWVIRRKFFDKITREDHDLLEFLTEVVAGRFNSKRPISDRQIGKYVATDIIGSGAFKTVFLVQEYLQGSSLRDMLNAVKRIPPKSTMRYLMQICRGLQYAHEHHIVHQDIKPSNIFILLNDKIRILDFGLATPLNT